MTTSTLNTTATQTDISSETVTSNVVNIRSARKAQVKAQQEFQVEQHKMTPIQWSAFSYFVI